MLHMKSNKKYTKYPCNSNIYKFKLGCLSILSSDNINHLGINLREHLEDIYAVNYNIFPRKMKRI